MSWSGIKLCLNLVCSIERPISIQRWLFLCRIIGSFSFSENHWSWTLNWCPINYFGLFHQFIKLHVHEFMSFSLALSKQKQVVWSKSLYSIIFESMEHVYWHLHNFYSEILFKGIHHWSMHCFNWKDHHCSKEIFRIWDVA